MSKQKMIFTMLGMILLASCGNVSNKIEKKLTELQSKAESLDSLINNKVDKVLTLDSLMYSESESVKKLDTLIHKSSSQLDSISKKGTTLLENITN